MKNIGLSAKCPCCGSNKTVRKEVEAFDEGWNIIVSIYNECRECKAEFVEEVVYREPVKYTIEPADPYEVE